MSFQVIKPGMLSLIQDYGRFGMQHLGVTQGGPLDEHAYLWANRLLDNHYNAPQIEITYGPVSLLAEASTVIAYTGADLNARLNGQAISPWKTYRVSAGDKLNFTHPAQGLRAYLAVKNGFKVKPHFGSCATVMREKLGGLHQNGEKLQAGDQIAYDVTAAFQMVEVPSRYIPSYQEPLLANVIVDKHNGFFDQQALDIFFNTRYQISPQIDRMGYRLTGTALRSRCESIISEGISYGAIQVPPDGQPIVLLKDRQTIGGYPKIGCVTALDTAKIAQRGPGCFIQFQACELKSALQEKQNFDRFFNVS